MDGWPSKIIYTLSAKVSDAAQAPRLAAPENAWVHPVDDRW